jgi:HSP20 family protein
MKPKKSRKIPEVTITEPVTDLVDEGEYIRVLVELPGVSEEKIRIDLERSVLTISASDDGLTFKKDLAIPGTVRLGEKYFQNGVLEIHLKKKRSATFF